MKNKFEALHIFKQFDTMIQIQFFTKIQINERILSEIISIQFLGYLQF